MLESSKYPLSKPETLNLWDPKVCAQKWVMLESSKYPLSIPETLMIVKFCERQLTNALQASWFWWKYQNGHDQAYFNFLEILMIFVFKRRSFWIIFGDQKIKLPVDCGIEELFELIQKNKFLVSGAKMIKIYLFCRFLMIFGNFMEFSTSGFKIHVSRQFSGSGDIFPTAAIWTQG